MGNAALSNPEQAEMGRWTTGICGCFEDWTSCCCGFCFPCALVGQNVEVLDRGFNGCGSACCTCCCLQCACSGYCYTYGYRARMRQKFDLPPEPCGDCCTDYCCLCCSITQINRELKNRGIDTSLGWHGVKDIYDGMGVPPGPVQMVIQQVHAPQAQVMGYPVPGPP